MLHILPGIPLGPKPTTSLKKVFRSWGQLSKSRQKLDVILENKVVQKLMFSKNVNNKRCAPKMKRTKTHHTLVKTNSFIRFLGESSARQKRFEIT